MTLKCYCGIWLPAEELSTQALPLLPNFITFGSCERLRMVAWLLYSALFGCWNDNRLWNATGHFADFDRTYTIIRTNYSYQNYPPMPMNFDPQRFLRSDLVATLELALPGSHFHWGCLFLGDSFGILSAVGQNSDLFENRVYHQLALWWETLWLTSRIAGTSSMR